MQLLLISGIALVCLVIGFILGAGYAKIMISARYEQLMEKSKWATLPESK
jgi:hypothetical protein